MGICVFQTYLQGIWKNKNVSRYIFQGHSNQINGRCVVAALRDVPAERRHNTATVGPVTVALGNLLENIFVFLNTL